MGAEQGLTSEGLFNLQSTEFMQFPQALAEDADEARRRVVGEAVVPIFLQGKRFVMGDRAASDL